MSEQTLHALEEAIAAHVADIDGEPNAMVTDWFLGYGMVDADSLHTFNYVVSNSAPHAASGVGSCALGRLMREMNE